MRIGVDISPISKNSTSAHKVRGVGSYINMLVTNLPKYDKSNEYIFVEDKNFPNNLDLIHYPYFDPFFITLPYKFQSKTIVTVHDLIPLVFPSHFPAGIKGKVKWLIQKSRLKKADLIITDSDCSKKDVRDIVGISDDKIRTIYLAVDKQFKELEIGSWKLEIEQKFNLPDKFLLYVGDATWNKNLPKLIAAVKKTKHKLVLVGKVWAPAPEEEVNSNPWNKDLISVLKETEDDPQFIKLGFVSSVDLVKIYNLATALIMPSIYEGFGLPVLEAMSCGCPVITSSKGSVSEVAGNAVLYVDPESEENIRKGIERTLTNPALCEDLSRKGLARAKKFSAEKMLEKLIKAYEKA